jgi:hypothetical protein
VDERNGFPTIPVAVYGIVLTAAGFAWLVLQGRLLRAEGEGSLLAAAIGTDVGGLAAAIGTDVKGRASGLVYLAGIGLSFANRWLGIAAYVMVAVIWFIPDRRVERLLTAAHTGSGEIVGHARSRDRG